jgi:exopolysaccharide production protein ExoQ
LSEPEPQVRRAVISWSDVRSWARPAEPDASGPGKRGWRRIDVDGVFAFALFVPILFGGSLGQAEKPIFLTLLALYGAVRGKDLARILAPRLFLLIPAVLAAASTYWSALPNESLTHGLGLAATLLAGLLLSAAASPSAVFKGVTAAYLGYLLRERAMGHSMQGGMGDIGATAVLVAAGMVLMALRERAWLWAAVGAVAGAFELSALVQARPAGAVIGLAAAAAVMLLFLAVLRAGLKLRLAVSFLAGAGALTVGLLARQVAERLTEFGHGLVAGNPNLMHSADVWAQARALIADHRLLGMGYFGLWPSQAPAAAQAAGHAYWTAALPIHNSYIDMLVQFGWVGLWIIGMTLTLAVLGFARRFVWRPNLALCIWAGVITYELVRIQLDVIGWAPFSASALLLGAGLAAAFSPELAPPAERRPVRAPQPPATVTRLDEYRERKTKKADPAFRHPDRPS